MRVFVVMKNDYPDCVFSTETLAEHYVDGMEKELRKKPNEPWVNWRFYEFVLDGKI